MEIFIALTVIIFIFIFVIYSVNKKDSFSNDTRNDINKVNVDKVYISFTTIPSRIAYIDEMLKSVDIPDIFEIYLNLQSEFEYPEKEISRLKSITPKLKIFWSNEKLGPLSKIVPTLERLLETNSLVISVDDDTVYPAELITDLINGHNLNEREVTCNWLLDNKKQKNHYMCATNYTLGGGRGVLYPTRVMTKEILDEMKEMTKKSKYCYKADDAILSVITEKYGIKKHLINSKSLNLLKTLNYSNNDALRNTYHPPNFTDGDEYNVYKCCTDTGYIN